jgi:putative hydrolase of HD superfamily
VAIYNGTMTDLIDFFLEAGKLKDIKRSGWLLRKVKDPETVAEHSFRAALMAWVLGEERGLDSTKLLKMLLIHDLVEAQAGDSTPYDDLVTPQADIDKLLSNWPRRTKEEKERLFAEKHTRELKALNDLIKKLPPKLKAEMHDLWMEYDVGNTLEGRFARQLDRIETLLQALEYEKKHKQVNILSFWYQLKELADDKLIVDFMYAMDEYFYGPSPHPKTKKTSK